MPVCTLVKHCSPYISFCSSVLLHLDLCFVLLDLTCLFFFACSLLDYTCLNCLPWFWPLPASLFRKLRTFFVCLNKLLYCTSSASVVCIWIQFPVFLVTLLVLEDIPAGVLGLSQDSWKLQTKLLFFLLNIVNHLSVIMSAVVCGAGMYRLTNECWWCCREFERGREGLMTRCYWAVLWEV